MILEREKCELKPSTKAEVFWHETLLQYPVAIEKEKATKFRNVFSLGRENSGVLLLNQSRPCEN